jgi:hypothetical protein
MTNPKSYFSVPNRLHSMADVDRVLAERTRKINGTGSSAPAGDASDSGRVGDSKAGEAPVRTLSLEWRPQVKGMEAVLSACGRYSVSRAAVDGRFCYTAWSRLPLPISIGEGQYVAELAKELCQAHALGAGT